MNEKDSEIVLSLLYPEYVPVQDPEEADLIIVNTCSVREKPQHKLYSEIGRYKTLKARRPGLLLGVMGCVAQQEGEALLQKYPYVDFVLGTQGFYRLKEAIAERLQTGKRVAFTELHPDFKPPLILSSRKTKRVKAFVNIMQGCDNFCTYCIVPYVRGREVSRPPEEIQKEIHYLVEEEGVKEVILLGQNVNSYGKKEKGYGDFADLLTRISEIPGLLRIRFTTSHPKDLSEKLIKVLAENPKVCKHLHLPLQAGSNRILKLMNRGYTRDEYLAKVERLRELCPEIALTTDIIVGFPSETEEDFQQTLAMLATIRYQEIYSFKYSDRPFTAARNLPGKVPEEVKEDRLKRLQEFQAQITQEIYASYVGKEVEVLIEGKSLKNPNQLTGRTSSNLIVNFSSPRLDLEGELGLVKIEAAGSHSLKGRYVQILCPSF